MFSMVFQALVNMLVSVEIMPVTGQTLPLISMGGTSLVFTFISLGIILSVSRNSLKGEYEKYKIIISGGGTGGHIFPALAIAKAIEKNTLMLIFCLLALRTEWKWIKYLVKDTKLSGFG